MSNNKLLIEHIQKLKPKLKINSIQTYITNLYKICRELGNKSKKDCDLGDLSFLNDFDAVMKTIKDETLNTRKNRLIAIVVSLKAIDGDKELIEKYSEEMTKLAEQSEERVKRQKLTDKQREISEHILSAQGVFRTVTSEPRSGGGKRKKNLIRIRSEDFLVRIRSDSCCCSPHGPLSGCCLL